MIFFEDVCTISFSLIEKCKNSKRITNGSKEMKQKKREMGKKAAESTEENFCFSIELKCNSKREKNEIHKCLA